MVVITVIIAAILAVFAFGIGAPAKAPESKLNFVAAYGTGGSNNTLAISNNGGDSLSLKDEKLFVKNAVDGSVVSTNLDSKTLDGITTMTSTSTTTSTLTPGNTITYTGTYTFTTGMILRVQVLDVPTGQMVSDTKVTVQ